jgi:chromosome segregation ATPase
MDAEPSTSEPAPKPKFTGPMDKYLSDKRVEAAVNRAVKSITDNPADLERELRAFAQTGEDWRQKSMTLEQEKEAIQKKLDKVTKELEKVKRVAAHEIGDFNDAEDHRAILKAIVGNGYEHDESGRRLLRYHAAAIVEQIEGKAKAVKRRLSPANFEPDTDLYVALAITESIRAWMKEQVDKVSWPFPE